MCNNEQGSRYPLNVAAKNGNAGIVKSLLDAQAPTWTRDPVSAQDLPIV